jgi:t-SNARE complex subunit (syntaxin)
MPPAPVGPDRLAALGAALTPVRDRARAAAEEVLEHYPEVGDRETQAALDDFVDQAADLLREIDAASDELVTRLQVAARQAEPFALDQRGHVPHEDEVPR